MLAREPMCWCGEPKPRPATDFGVMVFFFWRALGPCAENYTFPQILNVQSVQCSQSSHLVPKAAR